MAKFIDNFNRADSAALGGTWVEEYATSWSIASNKCLHTNQSQFWNYSKAYNTDAEATFKDGTVTATFTATAGQYAAVYGRYTPGDTQGLVALLNAGTLYIYYDNGDLFPPSRGSTACSVTNGTDYKIQLIMNDTDVTAKVLLASNDSEIASVNNASLIDQNVSGYAGMAGTGATFDFDNFEAGQLVGMLTFSDVFHNGVDILASETDIQAQVYDASGNSILTTTVETDASGILTPTTIEDALIVTGNDYVTIFQTEKYEEVPDKQTAT